MASVDDYINTVIKDGDSGSKLLAALCSETLKNSPYVQIVESGMNGLAVLKGIPDNYAVLIHSAGADPKKTNICDHAKSLVDTLIEHSKRLGVKPIAFADVIDARSGDNELIKTIGNVLVSEANKHNLAILNGELAILGDRVNCKANISGTMINLIDKSHVLYQDVISIKNKYSNGFYGTAEKIAYAIFDPKSKAIWINSDGVGTKTEFYERANKHKLAVNDFFAMNLDDAIKKAAIPQVISGVLEIKGDINSREIKRHCADLAKKLGLFGILQVEDIGDRIKGYSRNSSSFNLSGSLVSVIDEESLRNPPRPSAGEYLIAIQGIPNPRSNGITDKRKFMVEKFGNDWHCQVSLKKFLEYLSTPSTILYPVFKDLIDSGNATSVYHMSGGAFDGKLARPLAKYGLFASLTNIFPAHDVESKMVADSDMKITDAYAKWPMGNDGFITTNKPNQAIEMIKSHGLDARIVSRLENAIDRRTGIMLYDIKDETGAKVYFSGKQE